MKRDEAIRRLQQHEADLKRLGVEHLYMFGSTARRRAAKPGRIPTLICFSIMKRASSVFLN
jgi:predicted nucleotidyltransferase